MGSLAIQEFNEGDVGLAGGIQVTEPANANLVTEAEIAADVPWDFLWGSWGFQMF